MILYLAYIVLPFSLLNLVDKPIEIDSTQNQIYVIISGPSCHECLLKVNEWALLSKIEMTVVIWYNKTIIQKKTQIKFYKEYISPKTWVFSKDLNKLKNYFVLEASPNIIVVKDKKIYYFQYYDLFTNKSKVEEFVDLIKN